MKTKFQITFGNTEHLGGIKILQNDEEFEVYDGGHCFIRATKEGRLVKTTRWCNSIATPVLKAFAEWADKE